MNKKDVGIYRKFEVTRTDGQSALGEKHHRCRYFVIDIDHDKFARKALRAYAEACINDLPELSDDLFTFCNCGDEDHEVNPFSNLELDTEGEKLNEK